MDIAFALILLLGFILFLTAGLAFLLIPRRIAGWSASTFRPMLQRLLRILEGQSYRPEDSAIRPSQVIIWCMRVWGMIVLIACAFVIYAVVNSLMASP